jgi:hypothetical protein
VHINSRFKRPPASLPTAFQKSKSARVISSSEPSSETAVSLQKINPKSRGYPYGAIPAQDRLDQSVVCDKDHRDFPCSGVRIRNLIIVIAIAIAIAIAIRLSLPSPRTPSPSLLPSPASTPKPSPNPQGPPSQSTDNHNASKTITDYLRALKCMHLQSAMPHAQTLWPQQTIQP